MSSPKIVDLIEANKILRFAKEAVGRYEMKIHKHGNLKDLQLGAYTDAAWAVRPDGSSQGGFVIFAAAKDQVMSDRPFELTVIDWASRRLTRVCRSSLSAETQAAANAVDELEWTRTVWHLMLWPFENPLNEFAEHGAGAFAITDAKSLYDASNSMSSGLKLSERRCAIELARTNERLRAMRGGWKWCNSAQQLADGLTKSAARSACLDSFARGVTCLRFDTTVMKAAKKVTHAERQAEVKELDDAAEKLNDNVYLAEFGLPSDLPRCRLAGCQNPIINASQGHKYCSRRHYYKGFAGSSNASDPLRRRAIQAAMTLAMIHNNGADATQMVLGSSVYNNGNRNYTIAVSHDFVEMIVASICTIIMVLVGYVVIRVRRVRQQQDREGQQPVPAEPRGRALQRSLRDVRRHQQERDVMFAPARMLPQGQVQPRDRIPPPHLQPRAKGGAYPPEHPFYRLPRSEVPYAFSGLPEYAFVDGFNRGRQYEARQHPPVHETVSRSVQGPVHYTRRNSHPRYNPLEQQCWGAWRDD